MGLGKTFVKSTLFNRHLCVEINCLLFYLFFSISSAAIELPFSFNNFIVKLKQQGLDIDVIMDLMALQIQNVTVCTLM